jgi:flagellar export protein FliJ
VAKFRFNLQPALEQRQRIEETKMRVVADIERERVSIEAAMRETQAHIDRGRDDLRDHLGRSGAPATDIRSVRMQTGAILHLEASLRRRVLEYAGVLKRLERARADLMLATVARKAVDALKTRRFDEWRAGMSKAENAAVDELAVMRAARGNEEGVT